MDYNAQHKNTTTEEEKKQIKKVLEKDHNYFKNTRPIKEGAYYEQKFKTKCLNCEAKFIKNIYLFDYCPVCKGNNLKEI